MSVAAHGGVLGSAGDLRILLGAPGELLAEGTGVGNLLADVVVDVGHLGRELGLLDAELDVVTEDGVVLAGQALEGLSGDGRERAERLEGLALEVNVLLELFVWIVMSFPLEGLALQTCRALLLQNSCSAREILSNRFMIRKMMFGNAYISVNLDVQIRL